MIGIVRGSVLRLSGATLTLMTEGGVGYELIVGKKFAAREGTTQTIYTHLSHREDAMTLYGFETREEKELFCMLLRAQGIGPKLALEITNAYPVSTLIEILFSADIARLKKIPGMGEKKAEKLLFELKDVIRKMDVSEIAAAQIPANAVMHDAVKALVALGFSPSEALSAVTGVPNNISMQTETLIREALRALGTK